MAVRSFDDTLEVIGSSGRYQTFIMLLTGLAFLVVGAQNMAAVFTAGVPVFTCAHTWWRHYKQDDILQHNFQWDFYEWIWRWFELRRKVQRSYKRQYGKVHWMDVQQRYLWYEHRYEGELDKCALRNTHKCSTPSTAGQLQ